MPQRIAISNLNATTIDILNTIRANASYSYQQSVPEITHTDEVPRVGEILYGYPALANEFINALVNRIALVKVKSATFNNAYAELKKGYLEFGEVVEEVFVNICKAREFSVEKAAAREFKRTLPDVRTAFHAINWKVQYPVTIQQKDLHQAFTSINGVEDLIAKIVGQVYTAAEYDEYLLFKYLLIKAVAHGKMYPVGVDATDIKNSAIAFRATSNQLTFLDTKYNASGVHTSTAKGEQFIFMDSTFNATYDVEVLAAAFNMDKAEFMGNLKLIDSFDTFDNDRFAEIRANTDYIEEVTPDELALMQGVKAIIADREWFQVYDNLTAFTETQVASGMYWNYFYNVWKTVSSSPFSNAVVFVDSTATTSLPDTFTATIASKDVSDAATVLTIEADESDPSLAPSHVQYVQTQPMVVAGIAMHKYGALLIPESAHSQSITLVATINGTTYTASDQISSENDVGDNITFAKG